MDGLGHGPRSLPVTGAGGGGGLVGGCRRARHTHTAHWRHRWWEVAETAAEARPPDGETDACVAWQLALAMPWHGMAWRGARHVTYAALDRSVVLSIYIIIDDAPCRVVLGGLPRTQKKEKKFQAGCNKFFSKKNGCKGGGSDSSRRRVIRMSRPSTPSTPCIRPSSSAWINSTYGAVTSTG